jgi:hypothetical protein
MMLRLLVGHALFREDSNPQRRAKTLFCVAAMAIGILLYVAGGVVYWVASITVLGGALPSWALIERAMLAHAFEQAATFLEELRPADEASQQPDQDHRDSPVLLQRAHWE